MALQSDFHVHSSFSGDCDIPMDNMIQAAINTGLKQICFTEHQDFDYPVYPGVPQGMFQVNTDSYLFDLIRLREKYRGQIRVLFGIELGMQPHLAKVHDGYCQAYDFDFIIASSHLCNKKDPYFPEFYEGRTEEEAYREYFSSILENIRAFQNFDIYGHLDYIVRYGPNKDADYSYEKYQDILDSILMLLIANGKGLEINTGGLKYGLKEPNPCTGILKRYRTLGGELITVGSDAHKPEFLGFAFDRAAELLQVCGFSYYTTYENRLPQFHKI